MLERFTEDARAVVVAAREHAVATTASEVRAEHLLMALLDQRGSAATQVLGLLGVSAATLRELLDRRRMQYVDGLDEDDAEALRAIGIDLDEVVRRVDRNLGGLTRPTAGPRRIRFSRSARKVLELALREAVALRHGHIGTEHLLLGLVREDDRVVRDALADGGVQPVALRRAVAEAVPRAG